MVELAPLLQALCSALQRFGAAEQALQQLAAQGLLLLGDVPNPSAHSGGGRM